ncbi:sulfotransferase family protein [Aromatoleum toluclasticum]|uniref:sulfotransferase family 2 domain-containing protein n=1 Tax=Aromatoleum toluclasticum TaxID=92003 RepID=UPI001D182944|nr:sulfotransferase family 2 domain-containing protein [Aromatoleum toluclasticum]MCC4117434.1 sulfotransferase family protein [Aromatoleum toluclasticum]
MSILKHAHTTLFFLWASARDPAVALQMWRGQTRRYLWKLVPKATRETVLSRRSIVDRSALDKILSDSVFLPEDFQRHSCIFIHVPKCAGSSIKTALFPQRTQGHMPLWFYERSFPEFFERAYKFCFVRNPLDRAYSAYRYLCSSNRGPRDLAAHHLVTGYDSFDRFVQHWLCEENAHRQIHFAPQWEFLCDSLGQIRMDYIGRQETIVEDFRHVCASLGVDAALEAVNVSETKPQAMTFETRTIDRIRRVYERDYELFGY